MKNHKNEMQCPTCKGKGRIEKDSPQWYKITDLFDKPAQKVIEVGDHSILVRGMLYSEEGGEPELAICIAPQAIGNKQGVELRQILEANLRTPVVLLTDNIHLARMVPIEEFEAEGILEDQSNG